MKGYMAALIFPRARNEETVMKAEITMSAVKAVDGMVIQTHALKHRKEIGKAGAVRAEADVRAMKMTITGAEDVAKDADGSETRKDILRQAAAEAGTTTATMRIIMTMKKIMMTMIMIQDAAAVPAEPVVDGLAALRIPRKEDGEESEG
jgi:hypothetical protein